MKTTLLIPAAIALQAIAEPLDTDNQLAQQADDLIDGLYNITDESTEFQDSLDDLE